MGSKPLQFLMVVALALSGAVAPVVRASVSCCGGDDVPLTAAQFDDVSEASHLTACCGGCSSESVSPGKVAEAASPDHSKKFPTDGPCDGDCHCSLCGAIAAMSGAVLPPGMASVFLPEELAPIQFERLVCAKDQRFDLLRPPQC